MQPIVKGQTENDYYYILNTNCVLYMYRTQFIFKI